MIPKIIHYCWFGGNEKPKLAKKCIESWKKFCPDYEIVEWNKQNFDVNMNAYTKMCYENKKFAFLTDYVRLFVVEKYGGIYFDTDVEVLCSFDDMLDNEAFFGFENSEYINTGVGFGAEKSNILVIQMLEEYAKLLDGKHGVISCPELNTKALVKYGLRCDGTKQQLEHGAVYPIDYFNPYDDTTGRIQKTKNTHSVHWFAKSWMKKSTILKSKITQIVHRLFGVDFLRKHS